MYTKTGIEIAMDKVSNDMYQVTGGFETSGLK